MLTKENLLIASIFLVLLLSAVSSIYWHSFSYKQPVLSMALYSFDKKAEKVACSEVLLMPENTGTLSKELRFYIDSKEVMRKKVSLEENKIKKETFCADIIGISEGKHFAEIALDDKRLFYTFEKQQSSEKQFGHTLKIISVEKDSISFEVKNFPESVYAPVEIFVNGNFEKAVYPSKPDEQFNEKINLQEGKNEIKVSALGLSATVQYEKEKSTNLLLFSILLIIAGLFVFANFVFAKEELYSKFALSFFATSSLLIALGTLLGMFRLFNLPFLIGSYISAIALFAFLFRKNFALKRENFRLNEFFKGVSIEAIVLIGFFLYVCLLYQWFTPSHTTNFNVFYERGTRQVIENSGLPKNDEKSYLGRPFTFVPGYFYLEGAFSIFTGLQDTGLFALTSTFATIFFVFSSIAFAKSLGIKKAAIMMPVLFSMNTLIFTFITLTPRHIIAFSFLLIALMLFVKKKWLLGSTAIFFGMMMQIPLALFYLFSAPFIGLFLSKDIKLKGLAIVVLKPFALAFSLFCILYAMLFISAGFPYQIMPEDWGYLIRFGPAILLVEPGILLFLFILLLLLEGIWLMRKETKLTREKKILLAACLASMAIQSAITQRFNLVSAIFTAVFVAYFLEYYKSKFTELFTVAVALLLMAGLYIALILVHGFTTSLQSQAGVNYLAKYSSDSENVLADPLYGHLIEHTARNKVLADLMVEYADEQKLKDAYEFLKENNMSILEKYDIKLIFSERFLVNEKVVGNKTLP
ncbi:MAG: hypothetical protein QXM75_04510, partial [Candidatus Diapherotrites archaeon]